MIQSVVEASAFKLGSQYLAENRIRIVDANAVQVTSAVIGNSGLHEQTILLKDGMLVTNCTCPLTEQPICRHCVAVLLEYHRWAKPQPQKPGQDKPAKESPAMERPKTQPASDINLRDLTAFVEWIQLAVSALDLGHPLPEPPKLGSGEVQVWVQGLQRVEARRREMEAEHYTLKADLDAREVQINRLTQQLQASVEDIKAAQATSQSLQQELSQYRIIVGKVSDMTKELDRFESQIKGVTSDLSKQKTVLENLSTSVKQASTSIQTLTKSKAS